MVLSSSRSLRTAAPALQPGRAAGAPGAPANVGTFVDVVCFCKCWNNMFNILRDPYVLRRKRMSANVRGLSLGSAAAHRFVDFDSRP